MKRNYKDIETILNLKGTYEWSERILIRKTDTGFEVNGFEFASVKTACDFIESSPKVSVFYKSAKTGARIAKASAREGMKLVGSGICWVGNTIVSIGASIINGLDK